MYCQKKTQRAWYVLGLCEDTNQLVLSAPGGHSCISSLRGWHSWYRVCSLIVLLVHVSWGLKIRPQNHHRTRNTRWDSLPIFLYILMFLCIVNEGRVMESDDTCQSRFRFLQVLRHFFTVLWMKRQFIYLSS